MGINKYTQGGAWHTRTARLRHPRRAPSVHRALGLDCPAIPPAHAGLWVSGPELRAGAQLHRDLEAHRPAG